MVRTVVVALAALVLSSCSDPVAESTGERAATHDADAAQGSTSTPGAAPDPEPGASPGARPSMEPGEEPGEEPPPVLASDGDPAPARLTIPRLDLRDFPVEPYRGRTDDARGTAIQNDGDLASPHGEQGGTGPGGVGNYQVTGHRLSSTMPFRYLPSLVRGDLVHVESGGSRYVYRITATRETSFREPASLREQRAAVPGRPGVEPTRAMITLSTCATLEDHAEGNYWSDEFDNPEHRIDKIGVLVRIVPM